MYLNFGSVLCRRRYLSLMTFLCFLHRLREIHVIFKPTECGLTCEAKVNIAVLFHKFLIADCMWNSREFSFVSCLSSCFVYEFLTCRLDLNCGLVSISARNMHETKIWRYFNLEASLKVVTCLYGSAVHFVKVCGFNKIFWRFWTRYIGIRFSFLDCIHHFGFLSSRLISKT
jgi:hypothetical protein